MRGEGLSPDTQPRRPFKYGRFVGLDTNDTRGKVRVESLEAGGHLIYVDFNNYPLTVCFTVDRNGRVVDCQEIGTDGEPMTRKVAEMRGILKLANSILVDSLHDQSAPSS